MNNDLRMYSKESFNYLKLNYDPHTKTNYLDNQEIESHSFDEYLSINNYDSTENSTDSHTYYYILFKSIESSEDSKRPYNTSNQSHPVYNDRRKLGATEGSFIKIYYGKNPNCPECNSYGGQGGGLLVLNVIFSLSIFVFLVVYFVLGLYKLCIRQKVKEFKRRTESGQKEEEVDEEGEGYGRMEEIQIRAEHNVEN